jgi:hypothetical protein
MSRRTLLGKPTWQYFLHLPGLERLSTPALHAADGFFDFTVEHGLEDPGPRDIATWARSAGDDDFGALLDRLAEAMRVCAPDLVDRIAEARRSGPLAIPPAPAGATVAPEPAPVCWDPIAPPTRKPPRPRRVSVAPSDLPEHWQEVLRRMALGLPQNGVAPSVEIVKRLREKLCQFAWSARKANLPVDISAETVDRYLGDLRARGEAGRDGLRWATLRASFEELHRFARYAGYPQDIVALLGRQRALLEARENMQRGLKFARMARNGNTTLGLLDRAEALLESAANQPAPKKRHQLRNAACILGIYPIAPLRNASADLVFGVTLHWSLIGWVIHTTISKTRAQNPDPFVFPLQPQHGAFIDAVLLGDAHPSLLPLLREEAISRQRQLFVLPDGKPTAKTYIPRIFKVVTSDSFTATRTMLHTDLATSLGAAGFEMAMVACHRESSEVARKHYETEAVAIAAVAHIQGSASARRADIGAGDGFDLE